MQKYIEENITRNKLPNTFYKKLVTYHGIYPVTTRAIIHNLHKISPGSWKDTIKLLKYTGDNELLNNEIFDFLIDNLKEQLKDNKCDLIKYLPNYQTKINKNTSLVDRICKIIYPGDKKPTARGKYRKLKSNMKKESGCFTVSINNNNLDMIKYLSMNSIMYNYYKNPENNELEYELKKKLEKLELSHLIYILLHNSNLSNIITDILRSNMPCYIEDLKKNNLYCPDRDFLVDLSKQSMDIDVFIRMIEIIFVNQKKYIYINFKNCIKLDLDHDISCIIQKLKSNLMPSDKIYINQSMINKKLLVITPKKYMLEKTDQDILYCCLKDYNIKKDSIIYYSNNYFEDKIKNKLNILRKIFSRKEIIIEQNYNKIKIIIIILIVIIILLSFYLASSSIQY